MPAAKRTSSATVKQIAAPNYCAPGDVMILHSPTVAI